SSSKRQAKLEMFGFEDDSDGEEGGSSEGAAPCAAYKIKYFGFDEMVEEEGEDIPAVEVREESLRKKMKCSTDATGEASSTVATSQDSLQSSQTILESGSEEGAWSACSRSGSIAKHNAERKNEDGKKLIFHSPKKPLGKAVYNARHWNHPEEEMKAPRLDRASSAPGNAEQEGTAPSGETEQGERSVFKEPPPPPPARLRRIACPSQDSDEGVSSLKCHKEDKELYTVVRQVKHFNEVLEFGETQEYTDDVKYLMSGLKPRQPLSTRCLSVISLAMKCAMPGFRMHLRAHGQVAKVFKLLIDAQENQNLALCTAALMYVLSRDRLNMDLDRGCLELLIRLLEMEGGGAGADIREGDRLRERIRKLCEKVHNRHLDLENMTTGHLAMETLLSLTSRRAGDWFKEELRLLGGLDHIVDKVADCAEKLRSADRGAEEKLVDSLRGAERCLRVLESVTVHNPENQGYLIAYQDSQLIVSTARVLGLCEVLLLRKERAETRNEEGTVNNAGAEWSPLLKALEGCLRASFGVLLNLTHDNEWGSTKAGEQDRLVGSVLGCVLHVPSLLPAEQRFDIRVLGLALLVNLVELSARNRQCLVAMESTARFLSHAARVVYFCGSMGTFVARIDALIQNTHRTLPLSRLFLSPVCTQLYLQREHAAQLAETQTDDIIKGAMKTAASSHGEWHESESGLEWVEASPEPGRTGRPGD
uniref:WAPL cohesin release factor b n=1 Tax=Petromyzon marinus TaxID=7757 RepID=S4RF82_PETMA